MIFVEAVGAQQAAKGDIGGQIGGGELHALDFVGNHGQGLLAAGGETADKAAANGLGAQVIQRIGLADADQHHAVEIEPARRQHLEQVAALALEAAGGDGTGQGTGGQLVDRQGGGAEHLLVLGKDGDRAGGGQAGSGKGDFHREKLRQAFHGTGC